MSVKFSIITPSFNQGRFLTDCIESVLAQTGVEVEHIVTDAGSTDETIEVLKRYPHLQWTSEADAGMSDGINKGFLRATGDWVMWLNCDDYLLPGALAKVAEFIRQHPEADVVHGDCVFVREDKTVIRRIYDHPADESTLLFVGCFIPSTSTFFNRRIIDSGHLLDVSYKVCMDWEFYMRLIRLGYRFGYLPEALAGFRWHGTNTSLVHLGKGNEEARKLQRQHLSERGTPPYLASEWSLRFLRRIYQAKRVMKRLKTHGRMW
jgi:glycosyltransferase involved in cell wall biosynthesis